MDRHGQAHAHDLRADNPLFAMSKHNLFLALAILCETAATTTLKKTEEFTRLLPSVLFVALMGLSFYLLSWAIKGIPIGIAYAIWSAVGIVLISLSSWLVYHQKLDLPSMVGIAFIIAGVAIIQLFSKAQA